MKLWKNTKTLDKFIGKYDETDNPEEAQIALLGSKPIDLKDFPSLKGIFRAGVGKDNVPFEEAEKLGIKICFPSEKTVQYIYEETADFTCALILKMLYRDIGTLDPWIKSDREALSSKILLVIGTGKIGSKVKDKMSHFMKVITYDVLVNGRDELNGMISKSDCITLHIPNVAENKGFFDKDKLSLMKNGSILINTARGAVVSEDDLYEELKKGRISAAFDVFWKEPYSGRLKELYPEKFFMTPHVASTCNDFLEGAARDMDVFIREVQDV